MRNRDRAARLIAKMRATDRYCGRMIAGNLHLTLNGPVGTIDDAAHGIFARKVSETLRRHGGTCPILVDINSTGGNVVEALTIYRSLRQHEGAISARAGAECSSAAVIILLAADHRSVDGDLTMLLHASALDELGAAQRWTAAVMRKYAARMERMDVAIVDILAERTGTAKCVLEKMIGSETFLSAFEAFSFGIAHEIHTSSFSSIRRD